MAFPARHTPAVPTEQQPSQLAVIARVTNEGANARHCALLVADVVEVMRPLPIDGLANMPPFVLGLSIIRGAPVPVVDAAALLGRGPEGGEGHGRGQGHERAQRSDVNAVGAPVPTRFVVLRAGERRVALAVAAVLGVRPLAPETLQALPPLLRHAGEHVVAAIGTLDRGLLTVLAGSYLVPPSLWEALAPWKASP